ncbi:MAG: ATP-binding protein [Actinomycetota bacterium]
MPGSSTYIKRSLEVPLKRAAREFPVVVLTGPRQSGKTTILKHLFMKEYRYISLELPDVRAAAVADPRGFLDFNQPPVIFDEIHYAPELLPYIKEMVDSNRGKRGAFLLSGSQNILLAERTMETLAGRAAVLKLMPLTQRESFGRPDSPFPWEPGYRTGAREGLSGPGLWQSFIRGWYPELVSEPGRDVSLWHSSYMQTYLERDVRTLRHVGDLALFQAFLRTLAARSAQLLNLTDIARDLGVAVNTVKAWLSVLEATYQVIILRPYFRNIGKRLVKTPKVFFSDVGTLCSLTGLKDPEHAALGPMGGSIMETVVLSEIYKSMLNRGEEPRMYFWRTSTGTEVDVVMERERELVPIEVKLTSTPLPGMTAGIAAFKDSFGDRVAPGYVIHAGDVSLPLGNGVIALPFSLL